jgi:hypothetical protein
VTPAPGLLPLAAERESAPVTDVGGLIAWTVGLAVLILLVFVLMRRGWLRRTREQETAIPPLPEPRTAGGIRLRSTGMYHGSTTGGDWLRRILAHGLGQRGRAELALSDSGITVTRSGATGFQILPEALRAARTDRGIAGKVVPEGGMLVITWEHAGTVIDSGFRSDHPDEHVDWVEALSAGAPAPSPVPEHTLTAQTQKDAP